VTAFYLCPSCGFENRVEYELDGYKPQDVRLENDEGDEMECGGCKKELNEDAIYDAASQSVWEGE